jgi:molybdate transport system substrate-binding protein
MRFVLRILSLLVFFSFSLISAGYAEEGLSVAAGAGYKRLVEELSTTFTARTGMPVQQIFGNMGQITAQAQESGAVDFIIGDKNYLDATALSFSEEHTIGKGKLVAAVAGNVAVTSLDNLTDKAVTRIALPDSKKAIYGRAATEFLTNKGIWEQIQPKLLIVGTVPQVTAYVVSGEVDIGFINLTEALAIKDKVGLLIPVDEKLYTPILIVAKRLKQSPNGKAADSFVSFLQSEEAQAMIRKQGL